MTITASTSRWSAYRDYRRANAISPRALGGLYAGLAYIGVLPLLGQVLPSGFSTDLLYLVPIVAAAWHFREGAAWYFACCAGVMRALSAALTLKPDGPQLDVHDSWLFIANACMSGAQFLLVAWLASRLREHVNRDRKRANEDPLTGLLNRRAFREALVVSLRARSSSQAAIPAAGTLAILDLDGFKAVNDREGHEAGDRALCLTATILQQVVRNGDLVARLGGDEFAVWLADVDADGAQLVLKRVVGDLHQQSADRGWDLSASIGIVSVARGKTNVTAMINEADAAMYEVKRAGRGHVSVGGIADAA